MFDPTVLSVANQLVANCRAGRDTEALPELYAADAVSVEAMAMSPGGNPASQGIDAIRGKHEWWNGAHDVHSVGVEGPFMHGADRFAVIFNLDTTVKESGERIVMREVAIYTVGNGKIVREEFFYAA